MTDEQTKKAIKTMAECGCKLESLLDSFPDIPKEEIVSIWNYIYDARNRLDDYNEL